MLLVKHLQGFCQGWRKGSCFTPPNMIWWVNIIFFSNPLEPARKNTYFLNLFWRHTGSLRLWRLNLLWKSVFHVFFLAPPLNEMDGPQRKRCKGLFKIFELLQIDAFSRFCGQPTSYWIIICDGSDVGMCMLVCFHLFIEAKFLCKLFWRK